MWILWVTELAPRRVCSDMAAVVRVDSLSTSLVPLQAQSLLPEGERSGRASVPSEI